MGMVFVAAIALVLGDFWAARAAAGSAPTEYDAPPLGKHLYAQPLFAQQQLPKTAVVASTTLPMVGGAPMALGVNYTRHVWTTGGQREIDRCRGAVHVPFGGQAVIAEHNHCGGAWVLKVRVGQVVRLTGVRAGYYKAVRLKEVPRGSSSSVLNGLAPAGLSLQTCVFNSRMLRLVGLAKVSPPKPVPTCAGKRATIRGTNGSDRIVGTSRADVIVGLGGNDRIDGRGGNDIICAGAGNDYVTGGYGNDRIYGGSGNDQLYGSYGNDYIDAGTGKDRAFGNGGRDTLIGDRYDYLSGGPGYDIVRRR